jgi:hypothetical protein
VLESSSSSLQVEISSDDEDDEDEDDEDEGTGAAAGCGNNGPTPGCWIGFEGNVGLITRRSMLTYLVVYSLATFLVLEGKVGDSQPAFEDSFSWCLGADVR